MTVNWNSIARESGWVARHPHQLAYLVHVAAAAGVVYGGLNVASTQSLVVDGLAGLASLLAQFAATRATVPTAADGALLLPKGTIAPASPDVSNQ